MLESISGTSHAQADAMPKNFAQDIGFTVTLDGSSAAALKQSCNLS